MERFNGRSSLSRNRVIAGRGNIGGSLVCAGGPGINILRERRSLLCPVGIQLTEIGVEGPVFLHKKHNVIDRRVQTSGNHRCRSGRGSRTAAKASTGGNQERKKDHTARPQSTTIRHVKLLGTEPS